MRAPRFAARVLIFVVVLAAAFAASARAGHGLRRLHQSSAEERLARQRQRMKEADEALRRRQARFFCNQRLKVMDAETKNDFIVSVESGYDLDTVLATLETLPENLQRFEMLGMFAATLAQGDVVQLLRTPGVAYVECDAPVTLVRQNGK